jgi:hypothetical protein
MVSTTTTMSLIMKTEQKNWELHCLNPCYRKSIISVEMYLEVPLFEEQLKVI